MNDKVVIKYDIFGTGENKAVYTFDEATEKENKEKFAEAMTLVFTQIFLGTLGLRKFHNAGVDISNNPKNPKIRIKKGAGEDSYTVEIKEQKQ